MQFIADLLLSLLIMSIVSVALFVVMLRWGDQKDLLRLRERDPRLVTIRVIRRIPAGDKPWRSTLFNK